MRNLLKYFLQVVAIASALCCHSQLVAHSSDPLAFIGDWSVMPKASIAAPAMPYVKVSGATYIESSAPPYKSWRMESGNVFLADGVRLFRGVGSFTVAWDASPDASVESYAVACGQESGRWTWFTNCGNVTVATVPAQWMTNYFVVFALDAYGISSEPSNEVKAEALKPTLTITKL